MAGTCGPFNGMGALGSVAAPASVGAMTVAGSYCAGSSAGFGLTGGKVVLPVRPVPSASTVNITAPAAAAKPIIFFGSIDRKSVGYGKSVSDSVDIGGRRTIKKKHIKGAQ